MRGVARRVARAGVGEEGGHRVAGAGGALGARLQGGGRGGPGAQGEGGPRLAVQGLHPQGAVCSALLHPDEGGEEQAEVVVLQGGLGGGGLHRSHPGCHPA